MAKGASTRWVHKWTELANRLSEEIRRGRTLKGIQRAFEDAGIEFKFEDSDPVGFVVRRTAAEK
jgi:hypothetical protein